MTRRQTEAARKNVQKAQGAARKKKTISKLSPKTRSELGKQGAAARKRSGEPGHRLEDRTRQDLYAEASKLDIPGRSKMGKGDLIQAIRRAR